MRKQAAVDLHTCFQVKHRPLAITFSLSLAITHAAFATSSLAAGAARVDDRALVPIDTRPAWQACSASDECVPLAYACSLTASNRKHLAEARAHLKAKGLDPAYFECARAEGADMKPVPQCVQARCGLWMPARAIDAGNSASRP